MKKLIFALLLMLPSSFAYAQSFSDQFNQVGQYVQQKSDDAEQYMQQQKSASPSQKGTPNQAGQIGTPIDPSGIVPDTSGILPDQNQSGNTRQR